MLRVAFFHWSAVLAVLSCFVVACGGAPRVDPIRKPPQGDYGSGSGDAHAKGWIRLSRNERGIVLSWCNMRDARSFALLQKNMPMGFRAHLNPPPSPYCGELSYPTTAGVDALLEGIASNLAVLRVRETSVGNPISLEMHGMSERARAYLQSTWERGSPVLVQRATTKVPIVIPYALHLPGGTPDHWELSVDGDEDCTLPLLALGARWMAAGDRSLPVPSVATIPADPPFPGGPRSGLIRSSIRFPFVDDHAALIARIRDNSLPFDPWFAMSFLAGARTTPLEDAWGTLLEDKRLPLDASELSRTAVRCFGNPWYLQVRSIVVSEPSGNRAPLTEPLSSTHPPLSPKEQSAANALADALRTTFVALRPPETSRSRVAIPHLGTYTHDGALRFVFAALGSQSDVATLRAKMTDPTAKGENRSIAQGTPSAWNARIFAVHSAQFFDKGGQASAWHVIDLRPNVSMSETEQNNLLQDARRWIAAQQSRSDLTREERALLDEAGMRILLFRPKMPDASRRTTRKSVFQKPNVRKATPPESRATP